MFRVLATITVVLVVLAGVTIGYVVGTQSIQGGGPTPDRAGVEHAAYAFYATLGQLGNTDAENRLDAMLAPEFTEQRLDLPQTLDREQFMRAAVQEQRTFPGRRLMPVRIGVDDVWAMVVLQTVDVAPGRFAAIEIPASSLYRREMLEVIDGRIATRIVLEGPGSSFRSLPSARIPFDGVGMQTIEVVRKVYAPHAVDRTEVIGPVVLVAESGTFEIGQSGAIGESFDAGAARTIAAPGGLELENLSDAAASLLVLAIVSVETPTSLPVQGESQDTGPGVTAQRIAQSRPFLPGASCTDVALGTAIVAPGVRLPAHVTGGHEIVVPVAGSLDASSERQRFLRTDAAHHWQDATRLATLEQGIAVAAPPGTRTAYLATGEQPASFWVFAVEFPDAGCAAAVDQRHLHQGKASGDRPSADRKRSQLIHSTAISSSTGASSTSLPSTSSNAQISKAVSTHHWQTASMTKSSRYVR